ncbi:MAG: hypothetical protein ABIT38_13675, partial [Gemmatimonadaceae bacterium]
MRELRKGMWLTVSAYVSNGVYVATPVLRFAKSLLLLSLLGCEGTSERLQQATLRSELTTTLKVTRAFAARTSLDASYTSCVDSLYAQNSIRISACGQHASVPSARVVALAARVSTEVRTQASVDALHASALLDLFFSDRDVKAVDRSVSFLEAATKFGTADASLFIDLSAAYMRRAELRQDGRDLLAALQMASRALLIDSLNERAAFNRALALERMNVLGEASAAFAQAAITGPNDAWRQEARWRARSDSLIAFKSVSSAVDRALTDSAIRMIARRDPYSLRAVAWDSLLPHWGEAVIRGDGTDARRSLELVRRIGIALRAEGRDTSLLAAVHSIEVCGGSPCIVVARGHAQFDVGRRSYEGTDYPQAIAAFDSAMRSGANSPALRLSAWLWKGISAAQSGPPGSSSKIFASVANEAQARGFVGVAARALSALATNQAREGGAER